MRKVWMLLLALVAVLGFSGPANAALTTIGTATYGGNTYNLIFKGELGGSGLIWLDYRKSKANWYMQMDWASGLGANLVANLAPGYTTNIDDWSAGWRLPLVEKYKSINGGARETESEMGHLYYISLGNPAWGPLLYTAPFVTLIPSVYYSGSDWPVDWTKAWVFDFNQGYQSINTKDYHWDYAMAIHPGEVSAVPVPTSVLLLA